MVKLSQFDREALATGKKFPTVQEALAYAVDQWKRSDEDFFEVYQDPKGTPTVVNENICESFLRAGYTPIYDWVYVSNLVHGREPGEPIRYPERFGEDFAEKYRAKVGKARTYEQLREGK